MLTTNRNQLVFLSLHLFGKWWGHLAAILIVIMCILYLFSEFWARKLRPLPGLAEDHSFTPEDINRSSLWNHVLVHHNWPLPYKWFTVSCFMVYNVGICVVFNLRENKAYSHPVFEYHILSPCFKTSWSLTQIGVKHEILGVSLKNECASCRIHFL